MSYSFNVRAATKAEAIAKVSEELAAVVSAQPPHAADRAQAHAAAAAFIDPLVDDDTQDVAVSISGSLWTTDTGIRQANVSVTASTIVR